LIQWSFIERVERMTHNDFEALSSVVGTLESISVGKTVASACAAKLQAVL
jgi:hypothetical protein